MALARQSPCQSSFSFLNLFQSGLPCNGPPSGQRIYWPLYLRQPELAEVVVNSIRYRDQISNEYDLHSFVVMANHLHMLITPRIAVSQIMQSLKRFTARECNKILGLTGSPFWQDESYDRLVRNRREFERIARYIEMNPVNAGLAALPEEFPWSSARPIANRPQVFNLPHKFA
jgi:REP element-mobilizing transposase RayT